MDQSTTILLCLVYFYTSVVIWYFEYRMSCDTTEEPDTDKPEVEEPRYTHRLNLADGSTIDLTENHTVEHFEVETSPCEFLGCSTHRVTIIVSIFE